MGNILKANIYEVKINKGSLFSRDFSVILKDMRKILHENKNTGILIFDKNKDKEISIWFDSFDYEKDFSNNNILKENICFLLAKDINLSIVENREKEILENFIVNDNFRPKILNHCIFLPSKNILIAEKNIKIGAIKKGITNILCDTKDFLSFIPKVNDNIIERLTFLADKLQNINLIDLKLQKFLKDSEDTDGEMFSIINDLDATFTLKLELKNKNSEFKKLIIDLFNKVHKNHINYELEDFKINFKNEKDEQEAVNLYENLVLLTIETEHDYKKNITLQEMERINYSKSIYEALIKEFNEKDI